MTLAEFEKQLQEGQKPGASQYSLRNENLQNANRVRKIGMVKKEKGKRAKLLPIKEIAVPWNPLTGMSDNIFNENSKFRPTTSVKTTIKLLKSMCNKHEEAKKAFMSYAGIDEWDSSDDTVVTKEDYEIFKPFIKPRVFSVPVVHINIPEMGTGQYGRDYKLELDRDPITGDVVGEWPLVLQANRFFRSIAFEEYKAYQEKIDNKEIDATDKEKKEKFTEIMQKYCCVSDQTFANYLLVFELPLGPACDWTDSNIGLIRNATVEKVAGCMSLAKYSLKKDKGIRSTVEEYLRGDLYKHDKHFGYFEVDMKCPLDVDDKKEIGLDTKFERPENYVGSGTSQEQAKNPEAALDSAKFDAALDEVIDRETEIERVLLSSIRTGTYDETVEQQLLAALPSMIDLEWEFLTESVILSNKNFISYVLGDEGDKLIAMVEEKMSGKKEGSYTEEDAKVVEKEFDINDVLAETTEIDLGDE